jgi:hypothetical protein
MAYTINKGSKFNGLALADDRFAAFETIRDANDPLMRDRRTPDAPLCADDYFGTLPSQNNALLHQMRLHALVDQAKRKMAQDQIDADTDRQEGYKVSF